MAEPVTRIVDGQLDWTGGVNGSGVKTIASELFPNGIQRNQLAWLVNGTVRGGGITQRTGWQPIVQNAGWSGLFQGAWMHQPDQGDPHIVMAMGGNLWRARVDTDNTVDDLSAAFGLAMPATEPQSFFTQAELFTIWQCGDEVTNPIFYWTSDDGNTPFMRRSLGFVAPNDPTNELPAAGPMDYAMQRAWYAFGRQYAAGDIVFNKTSGTGAFDYRDSVLHVTENPVAKGGDAFAVPTVAGNIRALKHTSNLDSALGQSPLFILTRRAVYACDAPLTRDDWTKASLDLMPLQKVALSKGGTFAERSVVPVNGDLFFCSPPNGDIRSLTVAVRYFQQWGNLPLSREENRLLRFNDRALMRYASGIEFDNRLWETSSPVETPAGVAFRTVLPLDFDLISTLQQRLPPAWEGNYEGLKILQLLEGDFGGRQRAFAIVWSDLHQAVEVWELTLSDRFENGDGRVTWAIEFPAFTWKEPYLLKELETVKFFVDKLFGTVEFSAYYRPDQWPCWIPWRSWKKCAARDCSEDEEDPCQAYPVDLNKFCESFEPSMTLPKPPVQCLKKSQPSNIGYQFQVKLVVHGWCRVRACLAYALPRAEAPFQGMVC